MDTETSSGRNDDPAVQAIDVGQSSPRTNSQINPTKSPESHQKSTNPFRKHEDASSPEFPRYATPETYQSTGARKNTPVRAVFYDLPTAHSSITSGTARNKLHTPSNKHSDAPEEEDSIPLQDLDLSKRDDGSSIIEDLPHAPLPAVLSNQRYDRDHDFLADQDENFSSAHLAAPIQPSFPEAKPSVFTSIKNAFVSLSSPVQTPWPRSRQSSGDYDLERSLGDEDGNQKVDWAEDYSNYHSSAGPVHYPPSTPGGQYYGGDLGSSNHRNTSNGFPTSYEQQRLPPSSPPIPMNTHPRKISRLVSSSTNVSLPEGSTVGNIVQHYVSSEGPDGEAIDEDERNGVLGPQARPRNHFKPQALQDHSSSSPLYEPLEPASLRIKKQRQLDKRPADPYALPPRFGLHKNTIAFEQVISSESAVPNSSSSWNPPESAEANPGTPRGKRAPKTVDNNDETFDESVSDAANSTLPSLPRISHRNPFRYHQARVSMQRASPDHCVYYDEPSQQSTLQPRMPLEREVSQALRRASGYSAYSVDSAASSILDYGAILDYGKNKASESSSKHSENQDEMGFERVELKGQPRGRHIVDVQGKGFYDAEAIPPYWINSHQSIRVPINNNGAVPDSSPASPTDDTAQQPRNRRSTPEDDYNDWETVAESGFGLDLRDNDSGLIGGTVHRAGSSIADTSDAGTSSIHITDLDEFGSTDRITQHPGTIQYSGDYRQRDLKKTKMPVLMPVYKEHKVNGYLADSMRVRQPPNTVYFQSPPPLTEKHKHPFKSSPPDVMPPARAVKPKGILRNQISSSSRAAGPKLGGTQRGESSSTKKLSFAGQSSRKASDWTDSYLQTGPYMSTQNHPFLGQANEDDKDRPSSWQYIMDFAKSSSIPGNNADSSGDQLPSSRSLKDKLSFKMLGSESQNDILKRAKKNTASIQARNSSTPTRQPPGSFYQGVRTVSDKKRPSWSDQQDGTALPIERRKTTKIHGTNTLRPLSLVADRQPPTPLRSLSMTHSDLIGSDDFVYRSPLAPPKRSTWQRLYTDSRLFEMQERAKVDGIYSSRTTISATSERRHSRRHLYEAPKLVPRSSITYSDSSLKPQKVKISVVVLALCALFPPLLILYALGMLDGIMIWYSEGEYSEFGKRQKQWAGILLVIEVAIIAILLVAFLVSFFKSH